ncbi:hypothetical protein, partial [Sansalvadorimonas verongulae]|uniref:hypothetical protein n=1 Tax=Sansalvadorimonas verongulae TaxID=2172824 RepID=UPI001E2921C2
LGRHVQLMEGPENMKTALDIYTRLRTRAAGGQVNTRSKDKEIELGLAAIFVDTGDWEKFDELQLEKQLFSGFEACLCLSIRHFRELTEVKDILPKHSILLGKAFHWAALAVENSGGLSASSLSQLAHCFRLLSVWPKFKLQTLGIKERKEQEFKHTSDFLFAIANDLDPHRYKLMKDDPWRLKERELLTHITAQACPPYLR